MYEVPCEDTNEFAESRNAALKAKVEINRWNSRKQLQQTFQMRTKQRTYQSYLKKELNKYPKTNQHISVNAGVKTAK